MTPSESHLLAFLHFVVLSVFEFTWVLWLVFFWLKEYGRSDMCSFWGGVIRRLAYSTWASWASCSLNTTPLSESKHPALRSPSHKERPWLGALVMGPSWEPASTGSHGTEPSWTPSPAQPSYDFTSSCHLTATVWLSPSQNHPAEPSQATEPRETKINVCVKPSSFGVVCYIETDNWNVLAAF